MKAEPKIQDPQTESTEKIQETFSEFYATLVNWLKRLKITIEKLFRKGATKIQIYKTERELLKLKAEFGERAHEIILKNAPEWVDQNPKLSKLVSNIHKLSEDIQLLKEKLAESEGVSAG